MLQHISFAQQNQYENEFGKAIDAFKNEDFEKAILYLEKIESSFDEIDDETKSKIAYLEGSCFYRLGNLNKAFSLFETFQDLYPSNKKILWEIKPILFSICSELGNKTAAKFYLDQMIELFYNNEEMLSGLYSDYAITLISYYLENKQFDKALDIAKKGLSVIDLENNNEQRELHKCSLYCGSGKSNFNLQNYDQAYVDFKNALLNSTHLDTLQVAEILYNIGICFDYANMPDSSLYYYYKAEKIYAKKNLPIGNRIDNAMSLGVNLIHTGDYLNALHYLYIAADGYEKLKDQRHLLYVYSYIYDCLKEIGNKKHLSKYSDYIKLYIKDVKVDDDRIAHICYSTYATILELEGNLNQAISVMSEVIDAEKRNNKTPVYSLSVSLYKLSLLMLKNQDLLNAEKYIKKSLDYIQPIKDKFAKQYIESSVLYAEILEKSNKLGKAIALMENNLTIAQYLPKNSITLSKYYSYLSNLYAEIGNYDNCLTYSLINYNTTLNYMGEGSYIYACTLINLYEAYKLKQQYDKAENCLKKASEIIKKLFGADSKEYYTIIHKKSISYVFNPSIKKGDKIFKKCLKLSENFFGLNSKEYATDLCWYGMFKLYSSKDKSGISLMQSGLNTLLNIKYETNNTLFFLSQLSVWCHYFKEYDLAYNASKKYYIITKQYIPNIFPYLVDWQRESLWKDLQENLQRIIPMAVKTGSPEFLKLAYNSLLFWKGLILQSNNLISNVIIKSEDLDLKEIHSQINTEKNRLLNVIDYEKKDSIYHNINRLQRQELNKLSIQEEFKKKFNIDWTDIRNMLKDEDVAIEFVSYPTQDCNSYIALVIDNKSTTPLCVPLFNDKEIKKYSNNIYKYDYLSFDLYKLIWSNLETYVLKNIRNIYFSADGIIHNLAIESLKDNNGKTAAEKWQLYRLSSTREILNKKIKTKYQNVILYGGLPFSNIKKVTKVEVDEIKKTLDQHNVTTQILSDSVGTEESFKALSGSEINLIHMATHGYFWANETEKEYKKLKIRCLIDQFTPKESALLRSGLMLSEAKYTLEGQKIDNNIEDGVLTAHEISTLKFKDLDLVVLSACETGLGEVTPDGVFGLQRGFKLAGAKSILMSLWEVDDDATKMLMVEFYKNYLKGETKSMSLKKAQEYVKSQPGFEDPYYWAGFILLDGLD